MGPIETKLREAYSYAVDNNYLDGFVSLNGQIIEEIEEDIWQACQLPNACKWCATGALYKVHDYQEDVFWIDLPAGQFLEKIAQEIVNKNKDHFSNYHFYKTYLVNDEGMVKELYDTAIERAAKEGV